MCCAPDHGAEERGAEQHEDGNKKCKQRCCNERNYGDRSEQHAHCITRDRTEFGAEEIPMTADECAHRNNQLRNVVAESLAL